MVTAETNLNRICPQAALHPLAVSPPFPSSPATSNEVRVRVELEEAIDDRTPAR
jgi:hypothetical protein